MGKIRVKKPAEGKRLVKALTRKQQQKQIEEDLKIKSAVETIEELRSDVDKLAKIVKGHEKRLEKLWAWKMETEMSD